MGCLCRTGNLFVHIAPRIPFAAQFFRSVGSRGKCEFERQRNDNYSIEVCSISPASVMMSGGVVLVSTSASMISRSCFRRFCSLGLKLCICALLLILPACLDHASVRLGSSRIDPSIKLTAPSIIERARTASRTLWISRSTVLESLECPLGSPEVSFALFGDLAGRPVAMRQAGFGDIVSACLVQNHPGFGCQKDRLDLVRTLSVRSRTS